MDSAAPIRYYEPAPPLPPEMRGGFGSVARTLDPALSRDVTVEAIISDLLRAGRTNSDVTLSDYQARIIVRYIKQLEAKSWSAAKCPGHLLTAKVGQGHGSGEGGWYWAVYRGEGDVPGSLLGGAGTYPTVKAAWAEASACLNRWLTRDAEEAKPSV